MDKASLTAQMQPLSLQRKASPVESAYFTFYDIDLEHQLAGIDHHFGYVDTPDFRIASHLFNQQKNAKGSVFLLHGYYDHVGLFGHVIRFFLEQGFHVFAYDLPGHGLSSGRAASIDDFNVYRRVLDNLIKQVDAELPKPWLAYGQSTGCAIISELLMQYVNDKKPLPFNKVVFSAPLVRPYLWWLARIKFYIARPFIKQIPRTFKENSRDPYFIEKAHNDPLTPTVLPTQWVAALNRWVPKIESFPQQIPLSPLILQGTHDKTVDGKHNICVLQKLYKNPEVLWLDEARHHLPNELKETRQYYMNWLSDRISQ